LAARFVREGWSIKDLARTLVLSNVYLRSVDASPESVAADPVNRLWSRMPRRRLTVEMWRDTLLSVSRELSEQDGPSLELSDPANLRRTVFGRVSRLELDFVLQQFDYPDPNIHASGRATTSTPIQKLLLLNSPFVLERCEAIARNTLQHSPENTAARIDALYRNVYARYPEDWERETGLAWLTTHGDPDLERWTAYTHVLVTTNTFHYRD
jgi:hypothetical protein